MDKRFIISFILIGLFVTGLCFAGVNDDRTVDDDLGVSALSPKSKPKKHYWSFMAQNDNYCYRRSVSKEDRENGIVSNTMLCFYYRGNINNTYTFFLTQGQSVISLTCHEPCNYMQNNNANGVEAIPVDKGSVLWGLVQDARNGALVVPYSRWNSPDTVREIQNSEEDSKLPPKFVEIGTFTANLMHEEGDRYLQVGISLKLSKPELEEKVKAVTPEINNIINILLQSKYPSQLSTVAGKQKLASEIKEQIEFVLGLRKSAPAIHSVPPDSEAAASATPAASTATVPGKKGIAAVLFTSFIIQ